MSWAWQTGILLAFCVFPVVSHEHPSVDTDPEKPLDAILWLHIAVQTITWGFLFPIGMVLGITRSRWHVPLQVLGFLLTFLGYVLGHSHKGRSFPEAIHSKFASILALPVILQLLIGIYLKLHINEASIRPHIVTLHGIIGKSWPILGWCQMLFGALTLGGYCFDDAIAQCLAHYIMGSAFIGYGILLAVALFVGDLWLKKKGASQEWFDSWVIMLWGVVNTFTEHHGSLTEWSHKDLQHTMLGVLWWTGGALGIFLSRKGKRTIVPAVIIIMTGWAMSAHDQALMISTKVHTVFGIVLMSAGLARLIEISFLLRDASGIEPTNDHDPKYLFIRSFQHLPPFLLVAAGLLFMSGTDEELEYVSSLEIDHVTYTLIMFSLAFIIYLHTLFLLHLYFTTGRNADSNHAARTKPVTGYQQVPPYPGVSQDAEVFELGTVEYDEDDEVTHVDR